MVFEDFHQKFKLRIGVNSQDITKNIYSSSRRSTGTTRETPCSTMVIP